jgi:signal transduction histidine kinase
MRASLRFKVALGFSALTIVLLMAQALGVRLFAEAQEERLIDALIHDDMVSVLGGYDANPALLPPFNEQLKGYVSASDRSPVALPESTAALPDGTHEIIVDGREIHVAIVPFRGSRLYRVYNFNAYEKHFKRVIDSLTAGTGLFALLTIWLAYALSGLLVRQVAGLARQIASLRHDESATLNPGRYDEAELVGLVEAFNDDRRRMADMIAREKAFTGNVSHELRTPLTAIKTSCELLDADLAIGEKSRARIAQIELAADRMRDTVNALLVLAREESYARTQPVALAGIVHNVLRPFADALAARRVDAVVDIDDAMRVDVNETALTIVLANLVDNAVRHTSSGQVRIGWSGGSLQIEDTGSGIAAEVLPHVFNRFYRASVAAPDAADGFGIGLALVRKLCERCGWAIALDSEPGRGTRVSLRLPLAAAAPGAA